MPIFGESTTPYDEAVEKVTAETQTSENWALMMDICDRVMAEGQSGCRQCLLSLRKRLNHRDPHVVLFALSLLDCLWNNGGVIFRREVSSKEFINELNYKSTHSNRVISEKTRLLLKKWNDSECKKDPSLSLVEGLYRDLLNSGYSFEQTHPSKAVSDRAVSMSTDPNVVTSEQEEEDIAKAIALSLECTKGGASFGAKTQGQYPQLQTAIEFLNSTSSAALRNNALNNSDNSSSKGASSKTRLLSDNKIATSKQQPPPVRQQVRAMYDFEAVEDNELSFSAGELIDVTDDSDQNWWRGCSQRTGHVGLFPASFVGPPNVPVPGIVDETSNDENTPNDRLKISEEQNSKKAKEETKINETVLHRCIQLLEDCDPTSSPASDPPELAELELASLAQAPLIDQRLFNIDKQLDELASVDIAIRDVLAQYDSAVRGL